MLLILTLIAAAIAAVATGHVAVAIALSAVALVALAGRPANRDVLNLSDEAGSIATFVPEFWIQQLKRKLRTAHVYGDAVNTDYQGTISGAGDTVTVNSVGEVTIFDYSANTDMPAPEALTTTQQQLLITESPAFNFQVDDIDAAQAAGNVLDGGMESATFKLRDRSDTFIAGLYTDVQADNLLGDDTTAVEITNAAAAYENLVELGVLLDEADVPTEGRFVVIPPWYHGFLLRDDRFVSFGTDGNRGTLANGQVGEAAGFNIRKSNNTPIGAAGGAEENYKVIAGVRMAASFAEQINDVEAYRPEARFADAVKGLHVYGAELFYPDGWAVLSAKRPA